MKAIDELIRYVPCPEARVWLGDMTPREAWRTCEEPGWMLWAAIRIGVDIQPALFKCITSTARLLQRSIATHRIIADMKRLSKEDFLSTYHNETRACAHKSFVSATLWLSDPRASRYDAASMVTFRLREAALRCGHGDISQRLCKVIRRTIRVRDLTPHLSSWRK